LWLSFCFKKQKKYRSNNPVSPRSSIARFFCVVIAAAGISLPLPVNGQQVIHVSSASALQPALDGVSEGGIIELAAGTYAAPSGGFTIFPDLSGGSRSFTVRAAAGANVVLTGGGTTRILTFTTPRPVTFERLTFANGVSTEEFHAGAVSVAHVQANFIGCVFQNNVANPSVTGGGAVWIDTSTVSFQGCVFDNNTSKNYAGAVSSYASRVYIRDCRFANNRTNLPGHSSFNAAGAIHGNASTIRIANSRFENNQAGYVGGAIYVLGPWETPATDLEVSDSLFTGNVATRDPGGSNPDPTTGGAIFMEDKVTARFYNCRFTNNSAQQGGAVSSFRSSTDIKNCVFQANRAFGTAQNGESLGGAIFVLSADNPDQTTNGGTLNRPPAQLSVTDCLIQGQGPGSPSARQGGGIFLAGDTHAAFGITVQQNGTQESNHTVANFNRVVFADLTTVDDAGNGTGGAVTAAFTTFRADACIVEKCSASQNGGGFQFVYGSNATITNTTFAQNTAGVLGGAVGMFGGTLNMNACNLVENHLTNPGGGSAFVATAQPAEGAFPNWELTGVIQNCVISNNSGGPATIYDGYRASMPFNRLQYSANRIYPSDRTAFFIDSIGSLDVTQVNALTLTFPDNSTCVKAPLANVALGSPARTGAILMVPATTSASGAPGETLPIPSFLGYTSSGATPFLDGTPQASSSGVVPTSVDGIHTLVVGSSSFATVPPASSALNISTRLPVGGGQSVLIGGFIIQGPIAKTVMIRAIGPSLPLTGALQDPVLELHDGTGAIIASNDNWRSTQIGGLITSGQNIDIQASALAPVNDAEAALIATLSPGAYTAVVHGVNNGTGVAVVEGYDLDADKASKLANISTRGFVQTGNDVMIGGFILGGGTGTSSVVIRGIGPSLSAFGITNPLLDPMLELHDANGATIDSNDDWRTNQTIIQSTGLAPTNDAESALLLSNPAAGAYTAILRGKNSGTGVGVVEVYLIQ
jgi:hypothetical protein